MSIQLDIAYPEITVGDRCRRARLNKGYRKPRDLAAHAPMSETTVRKYEVDNFGKRGPQESTLDHWARACGVTVDWLRYGEPHDGGPDGTVTPIRTEKRKQGPSAPVLPIAA